MELHLNARLIMNELIKINFIIMNTRRSNDDWLLVLESLINIHTLVHSLTMITDLRVSFLGNCASCGRGFDGSFSFRK